MALKQIKYENKTFDISYDILNLSKEKTIIFLHGWASSKQIMRQVFGKLLTNYKHIYIDLPGFGKSTNSYTLTTYDYGFIIKEFLKQIDTNIDVVVGHSFGGKVATLLNPPLLVLLSSAGIVEKKSKKTILTIKMAKIFNKFGLKKVTKLLRSDDVNMMSEDMYNTFKNVVDEDFSKNFANFNNKALLFWGKIDTATTLNSGKTINTLIKNSEFYPFDGDHFFFLKYGKDISKIIKKSLED
jgi:pimeloyl-ACP methyl ester carboxylesterase